MNDVATRPVLVFTASELGPRPAEPLRRTTRRTSTPPRAEAVAETIARPAPIAVAPQPTGRDLGRSLREFVRGPMLPALALAAFCSTVRAGAPLQAAAAIALVALPGATLLALLGVGPGDRALRLIATIATGAITLMVLGLVASVVGPGLGVERPLDPGPVLVVAGGFTLVGSTVATCLGRAPIAYVVGVLRIDRRDWRRMAVFASALALPVAAVVAAGRLNAGNGSTLAVVVMGTALLGLLVVLAMATRGRLSPGTISLALASATLAFAWLTTLRSGHLFGWDIQQERGSLIAAIERGRWVRPSLSDPYGAMASITVLPAMVSSATGIAPSDVLRWCMPVFTAILPVATFSLARRRAGSAAALAATLILVALQATTLRVMGAITRQEIAFGLFAVGLAVAFDPHIPLSRRRVYLAIVAGALAITHYSTAYVACVVLIGTWVVSRVVRGRGSRAASVVTFTVVATAVAASVLWNVVLTESSDNLTRLQTELQANGLNLLPGVPDKGLVAGWIEGTSLQPLDPHAYEVIVDTRLASSLNWLHPDPSARATPYALAGTTVAADPALIPGSAARWSTLKALAAQGGVFVSFGSVAVGLVVVSRRRRASAATRDRAFIEMVAAGVAMLGVGVVLRMSGTIADLYNPERAAIQAGIVLAPLVAVAIERSVRRWRLLALPVLIGVVVTGLDGSGWSSVVTGGRPASLSAQGEDVERFSVGAAEIGTVEWLAATLPDGSILQADRYGAMALLNRQLPASIAVVDVIVPAAIDGSAWVYETRANVVDGHGRGAEGRRPALFEFPSNYLDDTKSVVYSTGETNVAR